MSVLDTLEELLVDQADDWLDDLTDGAGELADEHLSPGEAALAKGGLSLLKDAGSELAHLGAGGLVSVVARYAGGDVDGARIRYLGSGKATIDELVDASRASTAASVAATQAREATWESVQATLEELGAVALKILPLLLMAA